MDVSQGGGGGEGGRTQGEDRGTGGRGRSSLAPLEQPGRHEWAIMPGVSYTSVFPRLTTLPLPVG